MQGKKKYKLKPGAYLIIILLVILIIYFVMPKSHNKDYKINDYNIKEIFNNKNKRYNLNITKDDKILTLSTCYSDTEKLVLHAKLIKKEVRK